MDFGYIIISEIMSNLILNYYEERQEKLDGETPLVRDLPRARSNNRKKSSQLQSTILFDPRCPLKVEIMAKI